MSKPGFIYQLITKPFKESDDTELYVAISDNDNLVADDVDVTIYGLTAASDCFRLSVIDNDEDPFTVVKSQQAVIRIITDSNYNLNLFASGTDQRWSVHAYLDNDNTKTVFKGFLSLSDLEQDFMPHPCILTLTATDNLGVLKDIPLTDFDGNNPTYYNKLIDYIVWALSKTGLSLELRVAFNIRLNGSTGHLFNEAYLDAKTFEDLIGSSENCYTVLEKILGEEAFLFQRQGKWYIIKVDEMQGSGLYIGTFTSAGVWANDLTLININKVVQKTSDNSEIFFSKESTIVTVERPLESVKLTYNYEYPRELPCNIDFSRGVRNTGLDGSGFEAYDLECWLSKKSNYPTSDLIDATTAIFMKKVITLGYETERYVVIKAGVAPSNLILSEDIPVNVNDKFNLTLSQRLSGDIGGSGAATIIAGQVRLYGNDGTYWTLDGGTSIDPTTEWVACTSTFTTFQKVISYETNASADQTESISVTVEAPRIPVTGHIKLLIYQNNIWGDTEDTIIELPQFEYLAYINGTYHKYQGQYQKVSQSGGYKQTKEKQVYIAEGINPNFKGALFYDDAGVKKLATEFYNGATNPSGPPSADYVHPYSEIQVYDVWNQFNISKRVFQFRAQGFDIGIDSNFLPSNASPAHTFFLQDTDGSTNNKRFLLLTMNQDWRTCEWSGTLREVYDTQREKVYTGREFKYIS